jgi:hypothetical protein
VGEYDEKRFGVVAVERGFVTIEQVAEAMKVQIIEDMGKGTHRLIGAILLEQGLINEAQLNEVLSILDITSDDF